MKHRCVTLKTTELQKAYHRRHMGFTLNILKINTLSQHRKQSSFLLTKALISHIYINIYTYLSQELNHIQQLYWELQIMFMRFYKENMFSKILCLRMQITESTGFLNVFRLYFVRVFLIFNNRGLEL